MQDCHTQDLWIGLRKLVVLTLSVHQKFNQSFKKTILSLYLC